MTEIWRPITVYDIKHPDGSWKYEVSDAGHVRRTAFIDRAGNHRACKNVTIRICTRGYPNVLLLDENLKQHQLSVARAVALAFIPNPKDSWAVRHHDGDLGNNYASNLFWADVKVPRVQRRSLRDSLGKVIRQYTLGGKFVAEFESAGAAAKSIYISSSSPISRCCRRSPGYNTCGGFLWRYSDDDELYERQEG